MECFLWSRHRKIEPGSGRILTLHVSATHLLQLEHNHLNAFVNFLTLLSMHDAKGNLIPPFGSFRACLRSTSFQFSVYSFRFFLFRLHDCSHKISNEIKIHEVAYTWWVWLATCAVKYFAFQQAQLCTMLPFILTVIITCKYGKTICFLYKWNKQVFLNVGD